MECEIETLLDHVDTDEICKSFELDDLHEALEDDRPDLLDLFDTFPIKE